SLEPASTSVITACRADLKTGFSVSLAMVSSESSSDKPARNMVDIWRQKAAMSDTFTFLAKMLPWDLATAWASVGADMGPFRPATPADFTTITASPERSNSATRSPTEGATFTWLIVNPDASRAVTV